MAPPGSDGSYWGKSLTIRTFTPTMETPPESSAEPEPPSETGLELEDGSKPGPLERLAGFRFTYLAIFVFLLAYLFSIEALEAGMQNHFEGAIAEAITVEPSEERVVQALRSRVREVLGTSAWIRIGRIRVRPIVLANDGHTLLYAASHAPPLPPELDAQSLLPARSDVEVYVPHNSVAANSILVTYAGLLIATLIGYTRRLAREEQLALQEVVRERAALAERAQSIEQELRGVSGRLAEVEPEKEIYVEEIESLQDERSRLMKRLGEVELREQTLRSETLGNRELNEERRALEELLEEATHDLSGKDDEIRQLQKQVKRENKGAGKEADVLGRRLRTLYKNLEVDDHAIEGLLALGDESLKLRAEEALKRLSDDPETAGVRRKVGGLPSHLNIFEQGFAGKGRIYTTKGKSRRFRLLAVGGKNSQKPDLEYLSRLPKGT